MNKLVKQIVYGEVTAHDIARGVRRVCSPVAFSVARYGKNRLTVMVRSGQIWLTIGQRAVSFKQPDNIRLLVSSFNTGLQVNPITWSITGYGLDKYFNDAYIKGAKND